MSKIVLSGDSGQLVRQTFFNNYSLQLHKRFSALLVVNPNCFVQNRIFPRYIFYLFGKALLMVCVDCAILFA